MILTFLADLFESPRETGQFADFAVSIQDFDATHGEFEQQRIFDRSDTHAMGDGVKGAAMVHDGSPCYRHKICIQNRCNLAHPPSLRSVEFLGGSEIHSPIVRERELLRGQKTEGL